jgi:hypothetical protein
MYVVMDARVSGINLTSFWWLGAGAIYLRFCSREGTTIAETSKVLSRSWAPTLIAQLVAPIHRCITISRLGGYRDSRP